MMRPHRSASANHRTNSDWLVWFNSARRQFCTFRRRYSEPYFSPRPNRAKPAPMSKLTHFTLCPFSRSIRILLGEIDLDVALAEETPWAWRPVFLQLNPSGDLPVLELDDRTVLAGAYAISEYVGEIATRAPIDDPMFNPFPGTPEDRAEVRRLVDWFHLKLWSEVTLDLLREKVWTRLRTDQLARGPDLELVRALRANLKYHLGYMSYLADNRRWLAGDDMSFADIAAAAHLSILDYLDEMPWDSSPLVRDWYVRMKSRPSVRPLLTDHVPGIAPPPHYVDLDF